jgi:hypothetical protein
MRFYETTVDEYIVSKENYNLHPEINMNMFPKTLQTFENMIAYGPSGSGKYTQVLSILKRYSPSELKYEKKIIIQSEKQSYTLKMSDIHYEVDMSFLGCNSKTLWHDIFFQIVDIVAIKTDKIGIIVCKQFHLIHSELLDIFYSYMQRLSSVNIKFVLITEHISFIPNNILNASAIIHIKKPLKSNIYNMLVNNDNIKDESFTKRISGGRNKRIDNGVLSEIDTNEILNMKEIASFSLVKTSNELPNDIFNIICNQIISDMENINKVQFTVFRDSLYDIMIYNLDMVECLWYILTHFIKIDRLKEEDCSKILEKIHPFLQYYNNNYRPIYHLENIMFYIINILINE